MKKIVILFCACFFAFQISAQDSMSSFTDSGSILLNGKSDLNITFSDGTPTALSLGAAYFVMDNLAAGLNFGYFSFDGNSNSTTELFARYYVMDQLFVGAAYKLDDPTLLSASVGYNYFLSNKVSLEPTFTFPFDSDIADPSIGVGVSVFLY